MRKSLFLWLTPVVAGAVIIGTGYAFWQVGEQATIAENNSLKVQVEGEATIGSLSSGDTGSLTLDSTKNGKGLIYSNKDKRTDAVYIQEIYTPLQSESVDNSLFNVRVTFKATLDKDLAHYIAFDKVNDKAYTDGTEIELGTPAPITEEKTFDVKVTFKYIAEPQNADEYKAMKAVVQALGDKKPAVKATFAANVQAQ